MLFCLNLKRRLEHWKGEQSRKLSKGRSREGPPRGPAPNLFLDQTEARRDEKDRPPPPTLSKRLDDRPLPRLSHKSRSGTAEPI